MKSLGVIVPFYNEELFLYESVDRLIKQKIFHLSQRAVATKGYLEAVTWSFTDSRIDKQFSQGKKEIKITIKSTFFLTVMIKQLCNGLLIMPRKLEKYNK